jgi:hypothetical protein
VAAFKGHIGAKPAAAGLRGRAMWLRQAWRRSPAEQIVGGAMGPSRWPLGGAARPCGYDELGGGRRPDGLQAAQRGQAGGRWAVQQGHAAAAGLEEVVG